MGISQRANVPLSRRKIAKALNQSREGADEVEALVALFHLNRAFDAAAPKRGERAQRLKKCARRLEAAIESLEEVSFAFAGIDTYERLLSDARWQRDMVKRMLAEPMKKGPQADGRIWLICELAKIWEHCTGKRVINPYSPMADEFRGPFFEFVCLCFPDTLAFATRTAIGRAIQVALASRKGANGIHAERREEQSKRK